MLGSKTDFSAEKPLFQDTHYTQSLKIPAFSDLDLCEGTRLKRLDSILEGPRSTQ
jgi:hypothetical protein